MQLLRECINNDISDDRNKGIWKKYYLSFVWEEKYCKKIKYVLMDESSALVMFKKILYENTTIFGRKKSNKATFGRFHSLIIYLCHCVVVTF